MNEQQPDPDALLAQVTEEEARQRRGKLKVFFGAAAGVGKTYAMLEAAREAKADGRDVVVGYVETHGRAETDVLLEGLETVPSLRVPCDGTLLREMDLDAVLARRPSMAVVDELAHTNAPGSRHAKRWQDVMELLDAGIDVFTTVNVQHLESLNDVVAKVTGIVVRETVPDSVLEHGPGLPPGEEERVFEKFYRGGATGERGAGLGLAICKGVVESHGGHIWAHNLPEGGVAFFFTLPLTETPPPIPKTDG